MRARPLMKRDAVKVRAVALVRAACRRRAIARLSAPDHPAGHSASGRSPAAFAAHRSALAVTAQANLIMP